MRKPQHAILTLTPIDKKKTHVGMPPREQLRELLDTLDRTPVLVMGNRVWRPVGIVYEETTQYTTGDAGFHPPGSVTEMGIMDYIAQRGGASPEPTPAPEQAPKAVDEEPVSRGRRKIIIKADKRDANGCNKGNATKT